MIYEQKLRFTVCSCFDKCSNTNRNEQFSTDRFYRNRISIMLLLNRIIKQSAGPELTKCITSMKKAIKGRIIILKIFSHNLRREKLQK